MGDWLYLIIGLVVVAALVVGGLLTSGRRRRGVPPATGTDVVASPSDRTAAPAELPEEESAGGVATLERPRD